MKNNSFLNIAIYHDQSFIYSLREWYLEMKDYFNYIGKFPNLVSAGSPEFAKRDDGILRSLKKGESLFFNVQEEQVRRLGIAYQEKKQLLIYIYNSKHGKNQCIYIGIAKSLIVNDWVILKFIDFFLRKKINIYGFIYEMDYDEEPDLYASGYGKITSISAPPTREEKINTLLIEEWSEIGLYENGLENGLLRDIYKHNILNKEKIRNINDFFNLQDWIIEHKIGSIKDLSNETLIWSLSENQIKQAKDDLGEQGIIVCNMSYPNHSDLFWENFPHSAPSSE